MSNEKKIKVTKNGPYQVCGGISLSEERVMSDENNDPLSWKKTKDFDADGEYLLCRCGQTKNPPFCDGSHLKAKFDGSESKNAKKKYAELETVYNGPELDLHDAGDLCAGVGFCHRAGGTWELVQGKTDQDKQLTVQQSCDCPSGRLIAEDKKTGIIEPKLKKEISITQEPDRGVSGPIWAKGGIEIESENGEIFEKRNRVTLCRCGRSNNKPFCDGMHHFAKFKDKK